MPEQPNKLTLNSKINVFWLAVWSLFTEFKYTIFYICFFTFSILKTWMKIEEKYKFFTDRIDNTISIEYLYILTSYVFLLAIKILKIVTLTLILQNKNKVIHLYKFEYCSITVEQWILFCLKPYRIGAIIFFKTHATAVVNDNKHGSDFSLHNCNTSIYSWYDVYIRLMLRHN